jgi:hypothetical protein
VFMSLEPISNIFVACGVVGSSSLVSVISFLPHSLPVGVVSFLSSIYTILSYMFIKDLSSSFSLYVVFFLALVDPSSTCKQVQVSCMHCPLCRIHSLAKFLVRLIRFFLHMEFE